MAWQGDWTWQFPAESGVLFGRVVSGGCRFELPGIEERNMEPGYYLLFTALPAWILRDGNSDAAIADFENLPTDIPSHEAARSKDEPGQVRIIGGCFQAVLQRCRLVRVSGRGSLSSGGGAGDPRQRGQTVLSLSSTREGTLPLQLQLTSSPSSR
jgi:hypothetical protein